MESNLSTNATNVLEDGCDVCGEKHDTYSCPLVNLVNHIEDKAIPSRAQLSLPSNLYLKEENGVTSVHAGEHIIKGTQFGPFEAPLGETLKQESKFPLKVFKKDGTFAHLETSIEQHCNWMCLIQPAKNDGLHNLIAYQLNDGIFFSALRQIKKDEELQVSYSAGYAKKMGITPDSTVSENSPITSNELNIIDTRLKRIEQKDDDVRKFPDCALGAKKDILDRDKSEWHCSQCEMTFSNCVDFGLHLQDHARPLMQIEKSIESKKKNKKLEPTIYQELMFPEQSPNSSDPIHEVHVIISTVDPQAYNLRQCRKKSRALKEYEETLSPSKSKKQRLSQDVKLADDEELPTKEEDLGILDQSENASSTLSDLDEVEENDILAHGSVNSDNVSLSDLSAVNSETHICQICDKNFSKVKYLYRHLKKHTGTFSCSKCLKAFARNESLQLHNCVSLISDGETDKTLQYSCTFCDKVFGTEKFLMRHLAKHTGEIKCLDCGRFYLSQDSFDNHECTTKLGKFYECNICLKKFSQKMYLTKHLPIHTDQFKCPICDKTLRSNESLQNHTRICGRVQEIETHGKITCEVCSEDFTDPKKFRKHVYKHSHSHECQKCGARFRSSVSLGIHVCVPDSCRECGKTFNGLIKLEKHLLSSCGSQYACDKCVRPFQDEEALNQHDCSGHLYREGVLCKGRRQKISKRGTNKAPLICEICGLMFSSLSSLNVHRSLHGEKRFCCKICDKRFHRKDLMQEHESVHSEACIECQLCHKMFKTKKSLEVHTRIHRGVKRFKCELCGKEFFQKGNLQKHFETHNPDRRYDCDVCHKNFSTKEYLKIHQLEHSQGKIHNCGVCGRSFLKSHQLNHHKKIFHSNQSFVCRYCNLTLKLRHSLKRHLEKKHAPFKSEWDNPGMLASMAVIGNDQNEQLCTFVDNSKMEITYGEENGDERLNNGAEVILAVAGIGSKALERAIAEGKAHVKQGSLPDTIEISLPVGLEDEELTQSLVQNAHNFKTVVTQGQAVNVQESNEQNVLKVFSLQQASENLGDNIETQTIVDSDYTSKEDDACGDVGSKLVISTINQADQLQSSNSDGIILNFEEGNAQQIIVNQSEVAGENIALTDEGPILLYVVTDEMEEVKNKFQKIG